MSGQKQRNRNQGFYTLGVCVKVLQILSKTYFETMRTRNYITTGQYITRNYEHLEEFAPTENRACNLVS